MEQRVRILEISRVTHNVKTIRVEKPEGYHFHPGQATELSIDLPGWQSEKRPFTFTSLNNSPFLEFTIKSYNDHKGVTNKMDSLMPGDFLLIDEAWGAIEYKGPGYFIAGGAGITPFLAILRSLPADSGSNRLFFSNRTAADIIHEKELTAILGKHNVIFTLSNEKKPGYDDRIIDRNFLQKEVIDFSRHFYVCGPPAMNEQIASALADLGANPQMVVFEK